MMGPVNNNLGYLQYVLVAVAGAWLMSRGGGVAVGALMSFLLLTRSFNQPHQPGLQPDQRHCHGLGRSGAYF